MSQAMSRSGSHRGANKGGAESDRLQAMKKSIADLTSAVMALAESNRARDGDLGKSTQVDPTPQKRREEEPEAAIKRAKSLKAAVVERSSIRKMPNLVDGVSASSSSEGLQGPSHHPEDQQKAQSESNPPVGQGGQNFWFSSTGAVRGGELEEGDMNIH